MSPQPACRREIISTHFIQFSSVQSVQFTFSSPSFVQFSPSSPTNFTPVLETLDLDACFGLRSLTLRYGGTINSLEDVAAKNLPQTHILLSTRCSGVDARHATFRKSCCKLICFCPSGHNKLVCFKQKQLSFNAFYCSTASVCICTKIKRFLRVCLPGACACMSLKATVCKRR